MTASVRVLIENGPAIGSGGVVVRAIPALEGHPRRLPAPLGRCRHPRPWGEEVGSARLAAAAPALVGA